MILDIQSTHLREDNPYSTGTIIDFGDGEFLLEREPIEYTRSTKDRYYTTIQGERLHDVAFAAWKNSREYWVLMDVNDIAFPFELERGSTLLVPDLERIKLGNL